LRTESETTNTEEEKGRVEQMVDGTSVKYLKTHKGKKREYGGGGEKASQRRQKADKKAEENMSVRSLHSRLGAGREELKGRNW